MDEEQDFAVLGALDLSDVKAMVTFGPDGSAHVMGLGVGPDKIRVWVRHLADRMDRDAASRLN
jgi:hypothetical protein